MSPVVFVTLSGALTFGAPLIICLRELLVLRRDERGGSWPGDRTLPVPPPLPGGSGTPRPLPDCLIPRPMQQSQPARARELA
jgi:hypothetical protein